MTTSTSPTVNVEPALPLLQVKSTPYIHYVTRAACKSTAEKVTQYLNEVLMFSCPQPSTRYQCRFRHSFIHSFIHSFAQNDKHKIRQCVTQCEPDSKAHIRFIPRKKTGKLILRTGNRTDSGAGYGMDDRQFTAAERLRGFMAADGSTSASSEPCAVLSERANRISRDERWTTSDASGGSGRKLRVPCSVASQWGGKIPPRSGYVHPVVDVPTTGCTCPRHFVFSWD